MIQIHGRVSEAENILENPISVEELVSARIKRALREEDAFFFENAMAVFVKII